MNATVAIFAFAVAVTSTVRPAFAAAPYGGVTVNGAIVVTTREGLAAPGFEQWEMQTYETTDVRDWEHLVKMRYDALDDTWKTADGSRPPAMFFKWRVSVVRAGDE
ncbi:MAG: hypothetical protein IKE55_12160 [Kiritimatiellae bacterium]|nr:hypothetical protein [Kiritimatiellia bacterium]